VTQAPGPNSPIGQVHVDDDVFQSVFMLGQKKGPVQIAFEVPV
jgi:hypothetical protein